LCVYGAVGFGGREIIQQLRRQCSHGFKEPSWGDSVNFSL